MPIVITSVHNDRVKQAVRLRDRTDRDREGLVLIEGFRETTRALEGGWTPVSLFFCRDLFLGTHEAALIEKHREAGADLLECSVSVFRKLSYRDRPDGLLAVSKQKHLALDALVLPEHPLLLVMERVEKPGNLGTMLRSADAGGVDAVIVCDRCTDIFNPNAVRSSVGALFLIPVVEASTPDTLAWLKARGIRSLAATPSAQQVYSDCDLTRGVAIVVGSEQYGLSDAWMNRADERVLIPMLGRCDSLNVSAAATLLIYEAVRQRRSIRRVPGQA